MKMRRILSLDGGGIRGLVSCLWLQGVEDALVQAGKPGLLRHFDLLAGSSTGAVVACGLAMGLSPATMSELYRQHGRVIFPGMAERLWSRAMRLPIHGASAPRRFGGDTVPGLLGRGRHPAAGRVPARRLHLRGPRVEPVRGGGSRGVCSIHRRASACAWHDLLDPPDPEAGPPPAGDARGHPDVRRAGDPAVQGRSRSLG